jgi:hypothetical protein
MEKIETFTLQRWQMDMLAEPLNKESDNAVLTRYKELVTKLGASGATEKNMEFVGFIEKLANAIIASFRYLETRNCCIKEDDEYSNRNLNGKPFKRSELTYDDIAFWSNRVKLTELRELVAASPIPEAREMAKHIESLGAEKERAQSLATSDYNACVSGKKYAVTELDAILGSNDERYFNAAEVKLQAFSALHELYGQEYN